MFNVVELRQVDLNLLVVFATVFRDRSVKRAARHLLVGQSAVSMALGRLRDLFQDELFIKVAGGVAPTAKAIAIEPQVRQALEHVHGALFDAPVFDPATTRRIVRLGLPDDLELWLLPRLLDLLGRKAPDLSLVVHRSDWYTGLGLVERGEVEVVLGVLPEPGATMRAEPLFHQRFVSLFDAGWIRPPLSMKRFLEAAHVMVSASGDLVGMVDEALRTQGKARRLVAAVPGFATMGALLKGRPLIATLPDLAAATLAKAHGLMSSPPPVSLPVLPVSMVWHARTDQEPALRWFREQLRGALDEEARTRAPGPLPRHRRLATRKRVSRPTGR
ncbi:LysR substrate-binding domain-containing protein [Myxococcus sp. K15C18031901]|uniref:LysR substrate-binding domain-containing protein n=1 Tax=Myxococcus dinghuensis TaxID=2906761 RepID=UPI0020A82C4A|nr:LysR substrate-binding domain-containing protein [Myxococcus dinghuensis]MCP3102690.1 LysR substrate-binding domain-containing protein [Myxococcus dinghuensis]